MKASATRFFSGRLPRGLQVGRRRCLPPARPARLTRRAGPPRASSGNLNGCGLTRESLGRPNRCRAAERRSSGSESLHGLSVCAGGLPGPGEISSALAQCQTGATGRHCPSRPVAAWQTRSGTNLHEMVPVRVSGRMCHGDSDISRPTRNRPGPGPSPSLTTSVKPFQVWASEFEDV